MAPDSHIDGPTKTSRALVGLGLGLFWGWLLLLFADKTKE